MVNRRFAKFEQILIFPQFFKSNLLQKYQKVPVWGQGLIYIVTMATIIVFSHKSLNSYLETIVCYIQDHLIIMFGYEHRVVIFIT